MALSLSTDQEKKIDEIVARWVTTLALSFDHRVVDGEQGSRFLADVASILRDPAVALLGRSVLTPVAGRAAGGTEPVTAGGTSTASSPAGRCCSARPFLPACCSTSGCRSQNSRSTGAR